MLRLNLRPVFIRGAAYGMKGSFFSLEFDISGPIHLASYEKLCSACEEILCDQFTVRPHTTDHQAVIDSIFQCISNLWARTNHPYPLQIEPNPEKTLPGQVLAFYVGVPEYLRQPTIKLLRLFLSATCLPRDYPLDPKTHWVSAKRSGSLEKLINRFCAGPPTLNTVHLLAEAYRRDVPATQIKNETWRFGQGKLSRITQASFTDHTNVIGVQTARNKMLMANLLSLAGLPNLGGHVVTTEQQALQVAQRIGFPVVIKPLSKDGGAGVGCDLRNASDVSRQFKLARKLDQNVLVQKFVNARDFRVHVFDGKAVSFFERVAGGVIGDGKKTIAELIEEVNQEPFRGPGKHLPLEPLVIDSEANHLLSRAGLSPQSILETGEAFALRTIANTATGGTPKWMMETAHPDNICLAEQAAKAFRLDYAGIDLLLPDPQRSYRETGGHICEVNSQPVLGYAVTAHLYPLMLDALIEGNGRIPCAFILADSSNPLLDQIIKRLSKKFPGLGYVRDHLILLGGEVITTSRGNCFDDLNVLFTHRDCDAVLYIFDGMPMLANGLPVDRFDHLLVLSEPPELEVSTIQRVLAVLQRHIDDSIISNKPLPQPDIPMDDGAPSLTISKAKFPATVETLFVQAQKKHLESSVNR
jgi:D-alanine-D-alanine ligase-like ATP-grasp enzyme